MISAAAVYATNVQLYMPQREAEIQIARIAIRIIEAAATTNAKVLIRGGWGVGIWHTTQLMINKFQVAMESTSIRSFGTWILESPIWQRKYSYLRLFLIVFMSSVYDSCIEKNSLHRRESQHDN